MSLERAKRVRKGFKGGMKEALAEIVLGVPQHASLLSPPTDVPFPTSSVHS